MIQVFTTNLLDEAVSKTASSEAVGYPAENVYNIDRRRLNWRSAGYWLVVGGSNVITFQETIGVNKTATIAAGAYATDALFLAAIVTAMMGAAGRVGTYTATRDVTTGNIKITQSVAGGAAVFRLMWTVTPAFGTILGYDTSADMTGALFYIADELRIHTEEHFIFDLGFPAQPHGFLAVSDRNRPINIQPTATVLLMGNPTNNFAAPAETFVITVRDFLLGYISKDGISLLQANGYRYWKLQIIDNDNPDGYLELGAMGLLVQASISRGCPTFPYESNPIDYSSKEFSESGQKWVGKRPKTEVHNLSWDGLTNADFQVLKDFWEEMGTSSAFFVSLDPDSAFSSDGVTWCRLVSFDNGPTPRLQSPGNWSYAWNLREEL
jgi:hypothetical protein